MAGIIINTQYVSIEPTHFTESIGSMIDRAKVQTPHKDTDTSNWAVVSEWLPTRDIDLQERYQFCFGSIYVNPPIGEGA